MREVIYSCGISALGNSSDRFVTEGYKEKKSVKEMIQLATQVPDLTAIELVEGWHVNKDTINEVKAWIDETDLKVSIIHPDLWTTKKTGGVSR